MEPDEKDKNNFRKNVEHAMHQPRPLVRDSLSDEQSESLNTIYSVLREFLLPTFEQFERDFLREEQLDDRIVRWALIANGYHEFQQKHPSAEADERTSAMGCLTMLAFGGPRLNSASDDFWAEMQSYMAPLLGGNKK